MGMNAMGWTFLIFAWTFITVLVVWCFRKVITTGSSYDDND
jgi:hypothetical protein